MPEREPYLYLKFDHVELPPDTKLGDEFVLRARVTIAAVTTRVGGAIDQYEAAVHDMEIRRVE